MGVVGATEGKLDENVRWRKAVNSGAHVLGPPTEKNRRLANVVLREVREHNPSLPPRIEVYQWKEDCKLATCSIMYEFIVFSCF